jgi:hypothetical protein
LKKNICFLIKKNMNAIEKFFEQWCALEPSIHMTIGIILFACASASLFLKNRILTWVILLPLFANLMLRELCDTQVLSTVIMQPDFPHVPTPLPIPEQYPRTLPTPTMYFPPTALGISQKDTNMGDARSFWGDTPGLQGRSLKPSYQGQGGRGRGYAHYIPGSMS